jgi:hypothetical protein
MMGLERSVRGRAIEALHVLVGSPEGRLIYPTRSVMAPALDMRGPNLIAVAGDNEVPLDWTELRRIASKHDRDVIATYVDSMKSGHRFLIDVVLRDGGSTVLHPELRLWAPVIGPWFLAPSTGVAPHVRIGPEGLSRATRLFAFDAVGRIGAIARGQAVLQERIQHFEPHPAWIDF